MDSNQFLKTKNGLIQNLLGSKSLTLQQARELAEVIIKSTDQHSDGCLCKVCEDEMVTRAANSSIDHYEAFVASLLKPLKLNMDDFLQELSDWIDQPEDESHSLTKRLQQGE